MKLPVASYGLSKRNCAIAKNPASLKSYAAVHLAIAAFPHPAHARGYSVLLHPYKQWKQ